MNTMVTIYPDRRLVAYTDGKAVKQYRPGDATGDHPLIDAISRTLWSAGERMKGSLAWSTAAPAGELYRHGGIDGRISHDELVLHEKIRQRRRRQK